jgi:exodeoxyribonuclease V alpha subunit
VTETIAGRVERVNFHNPANGFSVLTLRRREPPGTVTAVGALSVTPAPGLSLELAGKYGEHPTYGPQFSFETATVTEAAGPAEPPPDAATLNGRILRVNFRKAETGFVVLAVKTAGGGVETAVGRLDHRPEPDRDVELTGFWKNHPRFGPQFSFSSAVYLDERPSERDDERPDGRDGGRPDRPGASGERADGRRLAEDGPATLTGRLEKVLYAKPDGSYAAVVLAADGHDEPVTAVGPLAAPAPGQTLSLSGQFATHPSFGRQFRISEARRLSGSAQGEDGARPEDERGPATARPSARPAARLAARSADGPGGGFGGENGDPGGEHDGSSGDGPSADPSGWPEHQEPPDPSWPAAPSSGSTPSRRSRTADPSASPSSAPPAAPGRPGRSGDRPGGGPSAATGPDGASETYAGEIEKVSFFNPETGYSVVRLKVKSRREPLVAVGQLGNPAVGEQMEVVGRFKTHPKYGLQFDVESSASRPPTSRDSLIKYLGSGLIKGVGLATATRLVDAFGEDVLDVLDRSPERLTEVAGLGAAKREGIIESWRAQAGLKQLLSFLSAFGLGPGLGSRILKKYGARAEAVIREDPYRLAYEVFGVGFHTADKVAKSLGFAPDCPQRLDAGLMYALDEGVRRGHDYMPSQELVEAALKLIPEAARPALEAGLGRLALAGQVMTENQSEPGGQDVYLPALHRAEVWTAKCLQAMLAEPFAVPIKGPDQALDWAEKTLGFSLSSDQREAARLALTSKVSIITGGPGTGKTTMTKAVCSVWRAATKKVALAAPTGRAAKRLSQATGLPATTVHRLLVYSQAGGGFVHGPDNKLDLDMLLLDEASMMDVLLTNQLLGALPAKAALILVGDQDQLPPVGPGRVLADLLESKTAPSKRLTQIYRQAEQSLIVAAAHAVNQGRLPTELSADPRADFRWFPEEDPDRIQEQLVELVAQTIPRELGVDPASDVMVLTPTRRGPLGTISLNALLGRILNPGGGRGVSRQGHDYRTGDRVMQVRNDYNRDVFNGDLGRVTALDFEAQELTVDFEDKVVVYDFDDLDGLMPAWACTVHKSQGSEFPAVVIVLHSSHYIMLRRKLLYTAVTRGRRLAVVVGPSSAVKRAVVNNQEDARHSRLYDRLRARS